LSWKQAERVCFYVQVATFMQTEEHANSEKKLVSQTIFGP
jgi:hypothetical protein